MSKMKSLVQLHAWWPGIDDHIVKACSSCQNARDPVRIPLHQWELPAQPWQRFHIDFAGPYRDKVWLLVIDVYSKWPEIHCMESNY